MNVRITACLLALTLARSAAAQVEPLFVPPVVTAVANVRGATPGDVDGDGLPDLVVWSTSASVLHNLGGMAFAPAVAVPGKAVAVQLADLNHDGRLDIVATDAVLSALVVRIALGNGNGTFAPYVDYDTVDGARQLVVEDFNGDGNIDVAAPGLHAGRVSVLLGIGDGSFLPKQDSGPVGDFASALTAADIDDDGVLDLAVASGNDSQVSLLHGVGDGSFTALAPVTLPGGVDAVAATDLDGDGDLDLVVDMVGISELRVVFNDGRGQFQHTSFGIPLTSSVNSLLVARDFDEDGLDDVAIGIGAEDIVEVFHATGLPGAAALQLTGAYYGGESPQDLSCADLDLDGDLDLIGSSFAGNDLRILRGEGDGGFHTAASGFPLGLPPLAVAAGDFNEDGKPDLVTSGTGPGLAVLLNAGNGHFPTATKWTLPDNNRPDVLVGDFNGDGHADVATADAGFFGQNVTIALGAGNGQLLAVKRLLAPGAWSCIDAADFDHDGDLDLVLGGGNDSVVRVVLNDGAGNLSIGSDLDTRFLPADSVFAADFNHDGSSDIAVAYGSSPGRISVFLGNGAGGFGAPVDTESSDGQRDIVAADFDGDGNLDVALSSYYGQFSVHAGHGDGSFGPAVSYGFLPNPTGLAVADLNHDGHPDLVTADNHQFENIGSLSVLIGNRDGTFQAPVAFRTGRQPWRVAVADFDGDGWNDLATAPLRATDVLLNRRGPWNELGHGLTGTQGIPRQIGTGTMEAGEPFAFTLRDARPFTTAYHVVGIAPLMLPFKGGTMVPTLDFINPFLVTDAQGTVVLQGPWISAPSGLTLYFQFWLPDPAAPRHFAASTAVSATMP